MNINYDFNSSTVVPVWFRYCKKKILGTIRSNRQFRFLSGSHFGQNQNIRFRFQSDYENPVPILQKSRHIGYGRSCQNCPVFYPVILQVNVDFPEFFCNTGTGFSKSDWNRNRIFRFWPKWEPKPPI